MSLEGRKNLINEATGELDDSVLDDVSGGAVQGVAGAAGAAGAAKIVGAAGKAGAAVKAGKAGAASKAGKAGAAQKKIMMVGLLSGRPKKKEM